MGKSAPAAPDYTGAAKEQATASADITNQQTWANRPTLNTPWGSQTWDTSSAVDPATGKPVTQWTSNINLTPEQQAALDSQQNIQQGRSNAAETLLGQATSNFQKPIDWNSLPAQAGSVTPGQMGTSPTGADATVRNLDAPTSSRPFSFGVDQGNIQTSVGATPEAVRQQAQDAVWNAQKGGLDQQRSDLENQLANQGLSRGSEAWNREETRMDDAYARARLQAVDAGRQEAAQMFGQNLQSGQFTNAAQAQDFGQDFQNAGMNNQAIQQQFAQDMSGKTFENQGQQQEFQNLMSLAQQGDKQALQQLQMQISAGGFNNQNRQQAIAEMLQQRGTTLNELNALLTGQQVNMPQMQNFSQASKSETPDLMGAAQNQYSASMDAFNAKQAQIGQLAQLGGSAAMMFSDIRLKENIEQVGILSSGLPMVEWSYIGLPGRHVGVIAQQALKFCPEAVELDPSGYLKVDYSKVH
jgi:hypothetical protein